MGKKRLNAVLIKILMSIQNVTCLSCCCCHHWNVPSTTSLCLYPLFDLHKNSASISECWLVPFFLHGGIQFQTFASDTQPCQMLFYQIATLLPSVVWQQNWTKCYWECSTSTSIPPTPVFDVVGQCNNIKGITFTAELVS